MTKSHTVTDLDKFALEEIWRPYQNMVGYEKRLERIPETLDETAHLLSSDSDWSLRVLGRIVALGFTFPEYIVHPIVDIVNKAHAKATGAPSMTDATRASPAPGAGGEQTVVRPSDPRVIIAGIRQFGLAADGSDLRDLEAAFAAPPPNGFEVGLRAALEKINEIRNSIIGTQKLNWSEHVYPLVAALDEAGFEGMGYPAAREYYGTLCERLAEAEAAIAALPAPATVSDSNKSVTEDELRTWLYQQFSKPTPLCDALLATYTITKKEAGL